MAEVRWQTAWREQRERAMAAETALSACQEELARVRAKQARVRQESKQLKRQVDELHAANPDLVALRAEVGRLKGACARIKHNGEAAEAARDENHRAHVLVSAECKQIAADLVACQEEAEEKLTHLEGMWAYERDRAETAETALSSEATKGRDCNCSDDSNVPEWHRSDCPAYREATKGERWRIQKGETWPVDADDDPDYAGTPGVGATDDVDSQPGEDAE